jgi:protein-tyrosine phosphatase
LDALGVDEHTILADYAESQRAMDLLIERLRAGGSIGPDTPPNPALGVMPSAMAEMLRALRERHGSARGFLRKAGVSPTVFDALEAELLEETLNA